MKYWNISDTETPGLQQLHYVRVTVTIGGQSIKPGESADLPLHLLGEAAPWVIRGVLSFHPPRIQQQRTAPVAKSAPVEEQAVRPDPTGADAVATVVVTEVVADAQSTPSVSADAPTDGPVSKRGSRKTGP